MTDKAWWASVLQWTLWTLAMTAVMGWLGRSRLRPRRAEDTRRLAHPVSTLIIGLAGFGFFAALAVVSNVTDNPTATWRTTTIFVGLALMSVPMIYDYFRARYELSDQGLAYRTLIGTRKHLRWAELSSVRYAPVMKWFRLESGSGDVVRLSLMLMGLPEFAQLLLQHASHEGIDADTLTVLRSTAEGSPPPLWT